MAKVVNLLSPAQRTKLLQIPDDFPEREIVRYYSLSRSAIWTSLQSCRRPQNRLGFTVQLAYLRYPGRAWNPEEQIPPNILTYLARQIDEPRSAYLQSMPHVIPPDENIWENCNDALVFARSHSVFIDNSPIGSCLLLWGLTRGSSLSRRLSKNYGPSASLRLRASTLERLAWETRRRCQ